MRVEARPTTMSDMSDTTTSGAIPADGSRGRRLSPLSVGYQTVVGLGLAAAIIVAWLALHITGVFLLNLATAPLWLTVLMVLTLTWLSVGLFIIAHDAMHGSLAPFRPGINVAVGQLALALYAGFRFRPLNVEHHKHHRHAGTADDPDFDARPPHGFFAWYYGFMRHYFGLFEYLVLNVLVATYIFLLGADIVNLLTFWALPALVSSVQLFVFGTYLPHKPGVDMRDDRHRSRSNDLPPWLSLLTCFHFGYHHEHHDQPGVPWWRLPAARREARFIVPRQQA
jgi:beta-carotene/zeaxanthin 4-ketolase